MPRVLLTTEGTYPYSMGGVSTWCDQFIRSLPQFDFTVAALVGPHPVTLPSPLPPNVSTVRPIHLWRQTGSNRTPTRAIINAFTEHLDDTLQGSLTGNLTLFTSGLTGLAALRTGDLPAALFEHRETWRVIHEALLATGSVVRAGDVAFITNWLRCELLPALERPARTDLAVSTLVGIGALPAWLAKINHGAPLALVEHGVYLRERLLALNTEPVPALVKVLRVQFLETLTRALHRSADTVLTVSHFNREWELHMGAVPERTVVIPNGVAPQDFPPAPQEPHDVPTVSWVGRVDPLKDLETLVHAFRLVVNALPQARLRLFGPIPKGNEEYHQKITDLIHTLELTANIHFEGPIKPVYQAYHAGDVVVLSSVSEGFPYTVIEAMMTGRPVVGTRVGGVAEAIGSAGLLVPSRSPKPLSKALLTLLRDPDLRSTLGQRARQRALSRFTLQKMGRTYEQALLGLLSPQEISHEPTRTILRPNLTPPAVVA